MSSQRTIGEKGLALIKNFEGLVLHAYLDAVGIPTIGYGSCRDVALGDEIDEAEADRRLRADLRIAEDGVNRLAPPLTQNQFDACVSLAFNVGTGAFGNSTLLKLLHAGDTAGAAEQFLRWNKAGGKTLAGLTRRREAERMLFLTPDELPEAA